MQNQISDIEGVKTPLYNETHLFFRLVKLIHCKKSLITCSFEIYFIKLLVVTRDQAVFLFHVKTSHEICFIVVAHSLYSLACAVYFVWERRNAAPSNIISFTVNLQQGCKYFVFLKGLIQKLLVLYFVESPYLYVGVMLIFHCRYTSKLYIFLFHSRRLALQFMICSWYKMQL